MSPFISQALQACAPYVPGEQPQDKTYIKLNTNECPYPPSEKIKKKIGNFDTAQLRLYPDPESSEIKQTAAKIFHVKPNQIFVSGGSDEALGLTFMAFFDHNDNIYFPDITYGFYKVYAKLFGLHICEIPLQSNFTINPSDYFHSNGHIILANPNAPTGIVLTPKQIEEILINNPDQLVVIDEAYIDFDPKNSCVDLINHYDNLLVIQTFSKSRALAGTRLGLAFGNAELIEALERVKYSFNPYNIDQLSTEIAKIALEDQGYLHQVVAKINMTREKTSADLQALGFEVIPSSANFVFAKPPSIHAKELYIALKEKGILVRYFDQERIKDYLRITIGTEEEMNMLIQKINEIEMSDGFEKN